MKLASIATAAGLILALIGADPAAADPKHGKGNGKGHPRQAETRDRRDDRRDRVVHVADCPPGLARKNPSCVPPGQARKRPADHGRQIGDILRSDGYAVIRDPRRHDLETQRGWDYYRDGNSVYRADSNTRKILAVINLIDAFSN